MGMIVLVVLNLSDKPVSGNIPIYAKGNQRIWRFFFEKFKVEI